MEPLDISATGIFINIISLADQNEGHTTIKNNDSFMSVVVEKLESLLFGRYQASVYSIAHYGELNGDLMADPEMTFLFLPQINKVYPMSFTNDYAGTFRECLFLEGEKWKVHKKEQADQALFANDWMNNIRAQQRI